jgi:tRNA threonylcarbamoyladenosine biosynthesis protein TsaB
MVLLAIDTATRSLGLALYDGKTLLAEQMWMAGNQHNALLAPTIQQSLAICELTTAELSAIAVTYGPGSYTGLRIGVALAKGMAAAAHLPLIGVNTLDVLAVLQPISTKFHLVCVVHAGRGRVIASQYVTKKGKWVVEIAPAIYEWEALLASLQHPTLLTGELDDSAFSAIEAAKLDSLVVVPAAMRSRRAGILAEEAWRRWQANKEADYSPDSVIPLYLSAP